MDILTRKETHFVLWRPAKINPPPRLVIGIFAHGNPPTLRSPTVVDLKQSAEFSELWELEARTLGLVDRQVYHYWFRVLDSSPYHVPAAEIDITDPFATTVDWRLKSPLLPAPYNDVDRDPAGVIKFESNKLKPCDPGGEVPSWADELPMKSLPSNNHLVFYELPTRWTRSIDGTEIAIGTFRDVRALIEPAATGANFEGLETLRHGAHLKDLGINALELLPPADSWVNREWGYATSNYLAADHDLGFPESHISPTASTDLAALVHSCHRAGIRFFPDVVMAFATRASYENLNFLDFHVHWGTGDPEQASREGYGGNLMKYNFRINGYDPVDAIRKDIVPARQWMKVFLKHWMMFYRVDGFRMDSVANFSNWDFIGEWNGLARSLWRTRWKAQNPNLDGAEERFLVVAEELAVPLDLVRQNRVDALWNEQFKQRVRDVVLGGTGLDDDAFARRVEEMVDCTISRVGFGDGAKAINYITSHDVGGPRNERLYNFLHNNGVMHKEQQIKLAFVCLLTSVGVPMIFAGEEFGDEHDLPTSDTEKQLDPVNFRRREEPWRKDVFDYVARLVHFRTTADALSVNDTRFLHYDFAPGRRVMAWERGGANSNDRVVVVANFSPWGTENPLAATAEYRVANWPALSAGRKWREITKGRDVPVEWAGREPIFAWEAKVYAMVSST
ncbi:hypothetical protein GJ744_007177 [Endocarpon pusillum]|uniref:Glycosyl hydrolase family 13 catalytic domain-containing protein n=1 Tax=Endocarpon pusillum TaxID=364733 RepID=A0A8H7E6J6_9EURO|nr:hypothetical protein GJ744_007177 [Endocarpon pusillum]